VGFVPCLVRSSGADEREQVHLGHPLLDAFLEFIAGRARWNTVLATAFDLKVFFSIIETDPAEVTTADVLAFITRQRAPRRGATVVRIEDGEPGLAARTIKRRLATITGLYEYLIVRGDTGVIRNPVPRGLALRRPGHRAGRGVPLIRVPRTLPRVINPEEVDALMAALRTRRDQAMVEAMLLGGLRRCEVLGLRLEDLRPGEKRVFIAEGKGGHQRIVPPLAPLLPQRRRLHRDRTAPPLVDGPRVRRVERPAPRPAADRGRVGRDRHGRPHPSRAGAADLPPASPHVFHAAPRSRHGPGSHPGASRASVHRVHPALSAPRQRLAGRGVSPRIRGDRRPGDAGLVMAAPLRLSDAQVDQVGRFVMALRSAGLRPWRTTKQAARTFCGRLQRAGGWARLSPARQLDATQKAPAFAAWLMVTGQLPVTADVLSRADLRLGIAAPPLP
jgi:integrase